MSNSTIESRISKAKDFFARYGEAIMADELFRSLVSLYREAIANTQRLMHDYGVVACCSACAARDPAGCCGNGVEEWYDEWLLISNLLMGCTIDKPRNLPDGCLFVGLHGCELMVRHQFCVNFLCSTIVDSMGPARTQNLLSVSGAELFAGWQLEQHLHRWIRTNANVLDFCRREELI